jgi:hypothetical protein
VVKDSIDNLRKKRVMRNKRVRVDFLQQIENLYVPEKVRNFPALSGETDLMHKVASASAAVDEATAAVACAIFRTPPATAAMCSRR